MTELVSTINEITKYGLQANFNILGREKYLEKDLIMIYSLYFEIGYEFDDKNYEDFDTSSLPNIRQNIASNFKDFGLYKTVLKPDDLENVDDFGIGDAIDDLSDVIRELLEVKWRIENNSLADGLWYFELAFRSHIKEHLINLLNYIERKNI